MACLFGTARMPDRPGLYYIGKLAVAHGHRNRGLARALVEAVRWAELDVPGAGAAGPQEEEAGHGADHR